MGQKLDRYLDTKHGAGWRDDPQVRKTIGDVSVAYETRGARNLGVDLDDFAIGYIEGLSDVAHHMGESFTSTLEAVDRAENGRPRGFKRAPGYVAGQDQPRVLKRREGGSS
ncbi:MAG: hypothetical protein HY512_03365 [Candidatus Aenigmarchaeota archaeon]|nr:hypothetical protein [Candidatus Aenigmarchaeota archaeon]